MQIGVAAHDARRGEDARQPVLRLVHQNPAPVITVAHPDAAGNKYGFEGGRVVKVGGVYPPPLPILDPY